MELELKKLYIVVIYIFHIGLLGLYLNSLYPCNAYATN